MRTPETMTKILVIIIACLPCLTAMTKAAEVKAADAPVTKVIKGKKTSMDHLESWEVEILEKIQLLENMELLQDIDLFDEDLAVLGMEDEP